MTPRSGETHPQHPCFAGWVGWVFLSDVPQMIFLLFTENVLNELVAVDIAGGAPKIPREEPASLCEGFCGSSAGGGPAS